MLTAIIVRPVSITAETVLQLFSRMINMRRNNLLPLHFSPRSIRRRRVRLPYLLRSAAVGHVFALAFEDGVEEKERETCFRLVIV